MHNFNLRADCVLDNGVNASVACFVKVFVLEIWLTGLMLELLVGDFKNWGALQVSFHTKSISQKACYQIRPKSR